jgi:hypothetical protein
MGSICSPLPTRPKGCIFIQYCEKLPTDVVRSHPNAGWLYLGEDTREFYPQVACRLFRDSKTEVDVIEPLICATAKAIKNGGLLISGQQEVRSNVTRRQAWWCVPGPLDDMNHAGVACCPQGRPVYSARRALLKKAGPDLVPCGPILGAVAVTERGALSDHTFSKGPHSGRDRFTGLQEASHYSQFFEDLGGVSRWFHR